MSREAPASRLSGRSRAPLCERLLSLAPLDTALSRLPPADRALLELSLQRGIPDAEIGTLLNLEPAEVRARRERILQRLAGDVGADAPGGVEELRACLSEPAAADAADAEGPERANGREEGHDVEELDANGGEEGHDVEKLDATGRLDLTEQMDATRRVDAPGQPDTGARVRNAAHVALLLLPGGLTALLGFNAGGFFAGTTALAAVVFCLALALRLTLAERPLAGLGPLGLLAGALLAAFTTWTLVSAAWSDAPARALIESDRALLYLLACFLFATVPRSARNLQVMLWGFAGAAAAVCLVGLASRVLPDVVSTAANVSNERLAYPVTYWNALGMLAALGIVACFHMAASAGEPRLARVLGAAAVPGLATTLFFTFSRGAIGVVPIALVIYIVLARPRTIVSALLAVVPPTVVAVTVAYGADRLASENPTAPAAAGQAHEVAIATGLAILAAALIRVALTPLDKRLAAVRFGAGARRAVLVGMTSLTLVAVAGAAVTLDARDRLERQYDRFVDGGEIGRSGDARSRLTNPANNGRLDHWQVALDGYRSDRVHGAGAGTYEIQWARDRPEAFTVIDAHSLYLETLAELGFVGLVLLTGALLTVLLGMAARIRAPDRAVHAALFAMGVAWAVRAGADWDWEMPVITLWFFALGGAALARHEGKRSLIGDLPRPWRVATGLLALLLALGPGLIYLSQSHLDKSVKSLEAGDCATAVDEALAATSVLSVRPEPFEVLAYCDVRLGRPGLAVNAMKEAVERDPDAWQLRYGTALVRAAAGRDPRPAARRALALNPLSPLTQDGVKRFRTKDPQKWKRRALGARLPIE